eukprot:676716_1
MVLEHAWESVLGTCPKDWQLLLLACRTLDERVQGVALVLATTPEDVSISRAHVIGFLEKLDAWRVQSGDDNIAISFFFRSFELLSSSTKTDDCIEQPNKSDSHDIS